MSSQTYVDSTTLTSAAEFNKFDTAAYAALTGVAGTNTITATGPANLTSVATNPPLWFIPAATNTGATTINITPSGGAALGAKNVFSGGAACSGGELVIGVPVAVVYDGTQYNIIGPSIGTRITNALGADVALNNTANYFVGPTVAQGTVGTWFVVASVTVGDTAGAATLLCKLWDGTTVIDDAAVSISAANLQLKVTLSGYITSPAGNLRVSCKDVTSTSGVIKFNSGGNSKDSTLSAIRIG